MTGHDSEVDQYIAAAPGEMQPTLEELRAMIRSHLPTASEEIGSSGFPVYTQNGQWLAGFAWRKKGPMLYIMASGVLDAFAEQLGPLRSGRSCVEWRASKTLSMPELRTLAESMLRQAAAVAA